MGNRLKKIINNKYIYIKLSPQWLCSNSCTWAHDVRLHIAGTDEPQRVLNKQSKESDYIYITLILLL